MFLLWNVCCTKCTKINYYLLFLFYSAAKYFVDNGLMINRKMTKCMAIVLCNKEIHIPSIYVHGTTISRVHHTNYLGYTISDDLNDNQAIIKEKKRYL